MSALAVVTQWLQGLVVPGLGALVAAVVFAALRKYIQRIDDDRLRELLLELVRAAEQIYGPGRGAEKRRYVEQRLRQLGLERVPREKVEAAVHQVNGETVSAQADG